MFLKASGVTVSDICKTTYEEIKKDKKHRYVVFFIKDEKQIDVEVVGKAEFHLIMVFQQSCRFIVKTSFLLLFCLLHDLF